MNWYFQALKKYAVFSGRARRREYWTFFLLNALIYVVLTAIDGAVYDTSVFGVFFGYAIALPTVAAGVRRMHDSDHRGWWLLFPLINLLRLLDAGTPGPNRFGPDSKEATASVTRAASSAV